MSHAGAILCGGRSSRFGADKALADVDGRPLAAIIVEALRDAGADPVVAIGGTAGDVLAIPTVPDRFPGDGPLGGLATALTWLKVGHVLVTPCDLPLLSAADLTPLLDARRPDAATIAMVDGEPQPALGCWPASHGGAVLAALRDGKRAWRSALDLGPWVGVDVRPEALADADSPAELAELIARARRPPGEREQ